MLSGYNVKRLTATGDAGTDGLVNAICSVMLTGGSAAATATIYDGTDTNGTVIAVLKAAINTSAMWEPGCVAINKGNIHVVLAGTGAEATVVYK